MPGDNEDGANQSSDEKVIDLGKYRNQNQKKAAKGRYGFDDYPGSPIVELKVADKQVGDTCSCCNRGKLYPGAARKMLRFKGHAPVSVDRYQKEVLRCGLCGKEYIASGSINKWEASARSAIALQKIKGMPFYRLSKLQELCGVPVAISSLWQQCADLWDDCASYIYEGLLQEIADRGKIIYADDTRAKILKIIDENKELPAKERRSCNTTVIHAETEEGNRMVVYITDNKHCGENLASLLEPRSNSARYLKLVVDASSNNTPQVSEEALKKIIMANCLAHGRRKFAELIGDYPEECGYFLREIAEIYKNESEVKDENAKKKLKHHKKNSRKHIKNIYAKINHLFETKKVEPNSNLGKAMKYWLRHRKKLTKFLRVKGIELDTNCAERALKLIILQRKNSLFFKSRSSAKILSGLSSLVSTCEENQVNAFGYLNWLQENWKEVQKGASSYFPWDYRKYLNDTERIAA